MARRARAVPAKATEAAKTARLNLRGRYHGGGYVVTSKHWWSPRDRKAARLAAKVLEHEGDRIRAQVRERLRRSLIYGEPL